MFSPKHQQQPLLLALSKYPQLKIKRNIKIRVQYYFADEIHKKHIGDIDNLDKSLFDAMVSVGILDDDKWIVESHSEKIQDDAYWFTCNIFEVAHV